MNQTIFQARQGIESDESGSDGEKNEATAKPHAAEHEHEDSNESEEESSEEEEEGEVEIFLFLLEMSFAIKPCLFCGSLHFLNLLH